MREVIRDMLARRPFIPFRLTLTGGATHDVPDPDLAELAPNVLRSYRRNPNAPGGREWTAMIALAHVVAVETVENEYPIVVYAASG